MLATDRWLMLPARRRSGFSINTTDDGEMEKAKDLLIEAKKTLLAYDDTTFYSKLVSGEAVLVQAWDGWCNYGIAENADIEFVVPEEGSDLWVDTMVVLESSSNKEAAHAFIDYVLRPDVGKWVAENILYKVPNKAAMEALDPALIEAFPNLGISPEELFEAKSSCATSVTRTDVHPDRRRRSPRSDRRADRGRSGSPLAPPGARGSGNGPCCWGPGSPTSLVLFILPLGLIVSLAFFQRGDFGGVVYELTLRQLSSARSNRCTWRCSSTRCVIAGDRHRWWRCSSAIPTAWFIANLPRRWRMVAADPRDPAVLDELPDPHVRMDRAAQPRGHRQRRAARTRHRSTSRWACSTPTCADRARPAVCLPAAHDPAAVRIDRATRPRAARGLRQPRCDVAANASSP